MEEKNQLGIPLEKILTASAMDYCASNNKNLSNYDLVGIHFNTGEIFWGNALSDFVEQIPKEAEVVVSIKYSKDYISETVLVPKKK